ncbi:MAG TPA: TAXI family TRAP transporter solute-binding subunit [Stellaceae bacterium]|nr:TAXI family TRAP transporter solute-binding subunit [Stellaceae bacterium]
MIALCGAAIAVAHAESLVERTNRGLVEMVTGGGDGAAIQMAEDIANVLDDGATRRVLPVVGHGSVQNLIDLRALRGVDIGIVQTDVMDYVRKNHILPGIENLVSYIAKLHNEEFHLLAGQGIAKVEDLANKKVEFSGGASVTGPAVFGFLGIKVEPLFDDQATAVQKLRNREVAAVAYVAAKPTSLFEILPTGEGLHFVAIPLKPELASAYVPARLTADDYPRLIQPNAPVDTIAVGAALVAANLQVNTERYRNVANFVDAFFTQFPRLQEAPRHPKWSEVNLAAELPGWRRFPPADAWLKRNVVAQAPALDEKELHDIFAKFLDERSKLSGGRAMSSQEKDKLFDQFRQWQTSQTR